MIKAGTPCFISKRGHNNFIYPIFNETGLTYFNEDVDDYEIKSWVCGKSNLRAIVVKGSQIDSLICPDSCKTVVWVDVEKNRLK